MPNNKIVLNGEVLIDLTEDTATEADVAKGKTFHRADGLMVEGTLKPSSGGGGENAKFVNFYDYDGTLLHQYTVEEAQELTELPELPSHDGLVCQGWNYTLAKIKEQVYGADIGATYITDDGKTRLYISIDSDGRMTVPICFGQTVENGVTVDWGDGSSETFTGTGTKYLTHEYSSVGDYVITLDPQGSCTLTLGGKNSGKQIVGGLSGTPLQAYSTMLKKAEIGKNTSIGQYAFYNCYSLTSVTIPASVTSFDSYAFQNCFSLTSVTIPASVTSFGNYAFHNCYSLTSVTIPASVTSLSSSAFSTCYSLTSVTIPDGVTSIPNFAFELCYALTSVTINEGVTSIGSSVFNSCYSLTSVTIPTSVTSIGTGMFYKCYALTSVTIPDGVTSIGDNMFSNCFSLTSVTIPTSVTSIGNYAFQNCNALTSVTIPEGVTSIGSSAFSSCSSLTSVTIPDSVTSIGTNAFQSCLSLVSVSMPIISSISASYFGSCKSMAYLDFTNYTKVPTLGNSSYITGINTGCKIRVPAALYDKWIVATNWSAVADRIVAV